MSMSPSQPNARRGSATLDRNNSNGMYMSEAFEYDGSSLLGSEDGGASDRGSHLGTSNAGEGGMEHADKRQTLENERKIVEKTAQSETRTVRIWRRNVLIVMLLTGVFVTVLTYLFLKQVDQEDFEGSFKQFAQSIRDSTEFNLRGLIEATNGLAQVFTSEAIKTNSQWPFMTLSSFEVYVRNTRAQGSSELIVISPLVNSSNIDKWNDYATAHQGWIDESFQEYDAGRVDLNPIPSSVYRFGRFKGRTVLKPEDGLGGYPAAPFWQMSRPPFDTSIVNFNALSEEQYQQMYDAMTQENHWVMGIAGPNTLIDYTISEEQHDELHSASERNSNATGFANDHPHTALLYPVYQDKDASHPSGSDVNSPQVAMILNVIPWDNYLKRLLPDGVNGVYCVLHNSAGQAFTYQIRGADASYVGPADYHETQYDDLEVRIDFTSFLDVAPATTINATTATDDYYNNYGNLQYWFSIYPSEELQNDYNSSTPVIFAIVVASVFVFMGITFILYDRFVSIKNHKILDAATHSNAILASLFPQNVKERLLEDKAQEVREDDAKRKRQRKGAFGITNNKNLDSSLEHFLNGDGMDDEDENEEILKSKPIADVFEESTVLFADLVGFTAWSSTREPTEVFILLETLYRNFDFIAKRRRVYKVETIGDCYVAVTGCPTPRKDHHVAMCRFSMECMRKMKELCRKLESTLGPDTSSLNMRFGLHSGSVTGGVLRGERSRFQLFGDTMNTAARIESNGRPGRVHLSGTTADLLVKSGKQHWLIKRDDKIVAKGKGEMQTYWLGKMSSSSSVGMGSESGDITESVWSGSDDSGEQEELEEVRDGHFVQLNPRTQRVVDWTVQSLMKILERLATSRANHGLKHEAVENFESTSSETPLEELREFVLFHRYPPPDENTTDLLLEQEIEDQLEIFTATIAGMYPTERQFHSFNHASHVTQTALKMFARMSSQGSDTSLTKESFDKEGFTLNIASDPLAVFAAAFACVIHDVAHPGVGNARLAIENPELAATYKGRSIAEQRSFTIAWSLLQEERFSDLRKTIAPNAAEEARFRQLVITCIIATDLFDKDLCDDRMMRWNTAFEIAAVDQEEESPKQVADRKATIVLEHLIQAADISHTMQHWQIYRKWNTHLYEEMHQAFSDGRFAKDPSSFWYDGEISFFESHVTKLASRITEFGCFGAFGEEFLRNANHNLLEWTQKGRGIVEELQGTNGHLAQEEEAPTEPAPTRALTPRSRLRAVRQASAKWSSADSGNNSSSNRDGMAKMSLTSPEDDKETLLMDNGDLTAETGDSTSTPGEIDVDMDVDVNEDVEQFHDELVSPSPSTGNTWSVVPGQEGWADDGVEV